MHSDNIALISSYEHYKKHIANAKQRHERQQEKEKARRKKEAEERKRRNYNVQVINVDNDMGAKLRFNQNILNNSPERQVHFGASAFDRRDHPLRESDLH